MFDSGDGLVGSGPNGGPAFDSAVASEASASYDAAEAALSLVDALGRVDAALASLGAADLDVESDRVLLDAAVEVQVLVNRLAGAQLRIIEQVDGRDAYAHDGALSTAAWLRARTRLAATEVSGQVRAAQRLRHLPRLRAALHTGTTSLGHVGVVTTAAIPQRVAAIVECDDALTDIATHGTPRDLATAVATTAPAPTVTAATPRRCASTGQTNDGR